MSNNISKVDRYTELLKDQNKLINASKSMIRKSRSPLAIRIRKGDLKAIMRAARDKLHGSLSKEKKRQLCKLLCELKNKVKGLSPNETRREIVAWAINGMMGIIDTASGLMISLLWVVRHKLEPYICPCKLDESCKSSTCISLA